MRTYAEYIPAYATVSLTHIRGNSTSLSTSFKLWKIIKVCFLGVYDVTKNPFVVGVKSRELTCYTNIDFLDFEDADNTFDKAFIKTSPAIHFSFNILFKRNFGSTDGVFLNVELRWYSGNFYCTWRWLIKSFIVLSFSFYSQGGTCVIVDFRRCVIFTFHIPRPVVKFRLFSNFTSKIERFIMRNIYYICLCSSCLCLRM